MDEDTRTTRRGRADEQRTPQRWTQGWRRITLGSGMLVYPCLTAVAMSGTVSGAALVAGYAVVAAFCLCVVLAATTVRAHRRQAIVLVAVMGALFLAALPFAHGDAFFLAAVVVSFVAVLWRRHATPVLVAATLAALLVPWAVPAWHTGPGTFQALALLFTALTTGAFAEIAATNQALVAARAEVARLASEAERNRIARDLHDLLGHSLTAITVKSRLAQRLAGKDPDQSLAEMAAVESLSRQALADVRAAVTGYRDVTLTGELARGRELLRAAGVVADLPTSTDPLATQDGELFGWVVREGLTNVVRHARAGRCTVTVTGSSVEIRDDGTGARGRTGEGSGVGKGLTGLRERVAAAGGTVEAGPLSPRGWRLLVTVPPGTRDGRRNPAREGTT
ncbi:two-component system sensor histidine kinase DesK [Kitasatospora sp. MAA19]|uniref:sensor histidine kinase n=1 Tax=Kitasatospora sp. MAA19 TaxID=3035090 RepID=UPI0024739641|nr:sensor histidine kinase [Kitasatospora sp. MAA19]MDH6705730.1 two-component system sensor histidine kinase DesK [Kitasatospora sp. MAA19]